MGVICSRELFIADDVSGHMQSRDLLRSASVRATSTGCECVGSVGLHATVIASPVHVAML